MCSALIQSVRMCTHPQLRTDRNLHVLLNWNSIFSAGCFYATCSLASTPWLHAAGGCAGWPEAAPPIRTEQNYSLHTFTFTLLVPMRSFLFFHTCFLFSSPLSCTACVRQHSFNLLSCVNAMLILSAEPVQIRRHLFM